MPKTISQKPVGGRRPRISLQNAFGRKPKTAATTVTSNDSHGASDTGSQSSGVTKEIDTAAKVPDTDQHCTSITEKEVNAGGTTAKSSGDADQTEGSKEDEPSVITTTIVETKPQARGWIRSCFLDPVSSVCSRFPILTGAAGTLAARAALWYLDSHLRGSSIQDHSLKDSVIAPAASNLFNSSARALGDLGSLVWSNLPAASTVGQFGADTVKATGGATRSAFSAIYNAPSHLLGRYKS